MTWDGDPVVVGSFPTKLPRRTDLIVRPWYASYANVARLAEYLADGGRSARTVALMVNRPHEFTGEFNRMLAADRKEPTT